MTSSPQPSPTDPGFWTPPPPGTVSFGATAPVVGRRGVRWRPVLLVAPALVLVAAASSIVTAVVVGGDETSGTGTAAAHAHGTHTTAASHATVGTIDSTHGSSWTLTTTGGGTVSVELGADTTYGSKSAPSTASAFHPGEQVKVTGTHQGSTVDARRVVPDPKTSNRS